MGVSLIFTHLLAPPTPEKNTEHERYFSVFIKAAAAAGNKGDEMNHSEAKTLS